MQGAFEMDELDQTTSSPNILEFPDPGTNEVPPPPEYGMVLDAPPPRYRPSPIPEPAPAPVVTRRVPWLPIVAGMVVIAGGVGLAVGVLGSSSSTDEVAAVAAATDASDSTPAEPAPRAAAALVPDAPCPSGMVHVTGGKFFMGTDRDVPLLAPAHPAHQVQLSSYCIDAQEVTVDEYRECSETGDCKRAYRTSEWHGANRDASAVWDELCNEGHDDRGQHPVNCVTWAQAQHYCEQEGGRLPTEAEWEFAARGSDGRVYSWGDELPDAEHMNGCGAECRTWRAAKGLPQTPGLLYPASDKYPGTAPVGSFPAGRTQWGLDDIAGNVFEWTADPYRPYPGAESESPVEDDGVSRRVIRGGAFNSFLPDHADPALRFPQDEQAHTHGIGFRCAADPIG